MAAVITAVEGMKTQMAALQQQANAPAVAPQQLQNVMMTQQDKVKEFDGTSKKVIFPEWVDDLIDLGQEYGWTAMYTHRKGCRAIEGPLKERLKKLVIGEEDTLEQLRGKYLALYVGDKHDFKPFQKVFFEYKQEDGESLDSYRKRIERIYQTVLSDYKTNPITAFFVTRAFCIGLRDKMLFAAAVPKELESIDDAYEFCQSRVKIKDAVRANYGETTAQFSATAEESVPMEIDTMKGGKKISGKPVKGRQVRRSLKKMIRKTQQKIETLEKAMVKATTGSSIDSPMGSDMNQSELSKELISKLINTVKSDSNNISFGKFCPVTANGVFTKALIDSGNLAGTCISYNFAKKLGLDKSDFTMEPVEIGTAKKGSNLKVFGNTRKPIKLQFGGLAKEYKVKPFVIRGFSSDVNISLDFLEKHKIDQIHSQHCLKIQGKLVRLHDSRGPLSVKKMSKHNISEMSEEKVARKESTEVYLDKDITIPANSAKYIKLRVPKVQRGFMEPGDGLLTSCDAFTERNDLHPCREAAVHVKKNGAVFIPVLNTLMRPVELRKNKKFGTFTKYTFRQLKRKRSKLTWPEQRIIDEFKLDSAPALRDPADLKRAVKFLKKFGGLFSENDEDFGETELIQHDIITDGSAPSRQKVKPTNPLLQEKLSKQIDVWLDADIIEEANSPWNSRLLPVPKKDNRLSYHHKGCKLTTLDERYSWTFRLDIYDIRRTYFYGTLGFGVDE